MNTKNPRDTHNEDSANLDPITKTPGAHVVGTGVGAAGGGAAGAAIGAVAGPVGAVVGAAIGAVAGGLAGKGVGEAVNPTAEEAYWRENYPTRPYAKSGSYTQYAPAYRYGWENYSKQPNRAFNDAENDLKSGWEKYKGSSELSWEKARDAVKDSWQRCGTKK